MANVTIDSLPAATAIANTDLFEVSQSLASRKLKRAELLFGPSAQNVQPAGALLSIASDGIKLQSNQNLFWDAANLRLGIGTNAPSQRLTIFDASAAGFVVQGSTTQFFAFSYSGFATMGTISNTPLLLYTNNTERLRIDASGNIGIGASAAAYRLDVSSPSFIGQRIYASNSLNGVAQVYSNNGGAFQIGIDSSTGGNFGAAYSGFLWHPGAYPILFGTNNTERLRITATGRVGINTSVPAAILHVVGAASTTTIQAMGVAGALYVDFNGLGQNYYDADTHFFRGSGSVERMRIDASGNVGIGTSAPNQKLHVTGINGSGFAGATLQNSNSGTGIAGVQFSSDATYSKAAIGLLRQNPNGVGPLIFYIRTATDAADWSVGDEKMRITADGNLGIGTSAPAGRLDVRGSNSATFALFSGASKGVRFNIDGSQTSIEGVDNTGVSSYQPLSINGSVLTLSTAAVERLRIDASGNVRVGTAALATTATDGFLYIPTCPGIPTGTPTAITGLAPIVINSTNNKLYFYSGGAWRDAGP